MIQVSCAIIEKKGKILAARRNRNKDQSLKWEFPGGKVRLDETPEQSIVREIKEELYLDIGIRESFPPIDHRYGARSFRFYPFLCRIIDGELVLNEHEAARWDYPDQLVSLDWAAADIKILHSFLEGAAFAKNATERTVAYYNAHAAEYITGTQSLDMSEYYELFLAFVPPGGRLLDAGCGSGRDTLYFAKRGYDVIAFDNSAAMVDHAADLTGRPVRLISFQDLDYINEFDGIWACASLLHVTRRDMGLVLEKLILALKDGGILYLSFKEGLSERMYRDRFFNSYSTESLVELVTSFPALSIIKHWRNADVRPGRKDEFWQNMIIRKGPV